MKPRKVALYNTLSKKLDTLKPISLKTGVGLYTCGPTVYNYAHIGNLRTYIFEDILERTLELAGYPVRRVMNITDVGHLTGEDTDSGEDKMEKEAKVEKKSVQEIAMFYTGAFLKDLELLHARVPELLEPATGFIPEQIFIIQQLIKKGHAYETPSAVYFDVATFKKYGKLSGQSLKDKLTAARKEVVEDPAKHNAADFALWFKLTGKFKSHLQHWPSPWGEGFPGWHIECSAISRTLLGQPFDIHTGGIDHIGTHHTNEIAQSEAAFGKPLAHIWMHGEFLVIDSARMGKSLGNFLTLSDIIKRGVSPLAYRYFTLSAHYRSQLNFTWESLDAAATGLKKYQATYRELAKLQAGEPLKKTVSATAKKFEKSFEAALFNDLNAPKALAVAHGVLKSKLSAREKVMLLEKFDTVFRVLPKLGGAGVDSEASKAAVIPQNVLDLVARREEARSSKQFMQSDALRKEINELGYVVEDTATGPVVTPK
jgi:cysteinyl-tRNA synthetase